MGVNSLRRHRRLAALKKALGVGMAVAGIALIVKTLPVFLWPLLLGLVLVWLGWTLYAVNNP